MEGAEGGASRPLSWPFPPWLAQPDSAVPVALCEVASPPGVHVWLPGLWGIS